LIDVLAQSGQVSADLNRRRAADALYAVVNEEVFQLLTRDCGWDTEQFATWATAVMLHQLLDDGGALATTLRPRPNKRPQTGRR
jgi:hypothetical protein